MTLTNCEIVVANAADHTPHADKEEVQRDIDQRREDQIVQRVRAVADGSQDAHAEVIQHDSHRAGKIVAEIGDGIRHDLLRRTHHIQHPWRKDHAEHGQEHARRDAEQHRRMHGDAEPCVVLRAEIARDHNARTDGNAAEKAHEQENQTARRGDRGILRIAQVPPDDQGIGGVIKLLKDLTEKDRDGKRRHTLPDRPLQQRGLLLMQDIRVLYS